MSYDIDIVVPDCPTCGQGMSIDVGNMTSNVSGMWTLALGYRLADLHGKKAKDCIADLKRAVSHMVDPKNKAQYTALNPENGWGNHAGAAEYLQALLEACVKRPNGTINISR